MRKTRRANAGLTVIEVILIIVCICALGLLLIPIRSQLQSDRQQRCHSQLKCFGTAMNIYLTKLGGDSTFAEPAAAFRGDEFVVSHFWLDVVSEPKLFVCPATDDRGPVDEAGNAVPIPTVWGQADNLADEQCSYAGRCKGLTGKYAYRNTTYAFTESKMGSSRPMVCDKAGNHSGGVNVVYADSHAVFIPDAGDKVGTDNSGLDDTDPAKELQYMDSGEE